MLKVKTYLDRSHVHGIGVFAGEPIPAGDVIWEFNPSVDLVYDPDRWKKLKQSVDPHSFAALERYSYKEKGKYCICLDNAQFMNHCSSKYNVLNLSEHVMTARHAICKGDELLCNYFEYSDDDDIHLCGLREGK